MQLDSLSGLLTSSNGSAIGIQRRNPEWWSQAHSGGRCKRSAELRVRTLRLNDPTSVSGILESSIPDVCHSTVAIGVGVQVISIIA